MAQCHSIMSSKLYLASKPLLILPHLPLDLPMLQTLCFSLCQFNTQETPPATNTPFIPVPHPDRASMGQSRGKEDSVGTDRIQQEWGHLAAAWKFPEGWASSLPSWLLHIT